MKKVLCLMLVVVLTSVFRIINIYALDASITKDSFTWSDVNDYDLSKLKCDNASIISGDITSGNVLRRRSGNIKFTSSKNSKVTCTIYLSKDLTGNDRDVDIISRSYGNNTTTKQQQTQAPVTTTRQTQVIPKSNNANIKSLTIKGNDNSEVILSPTFNSLVYDYEAMVSSTVTSVQILPILDDSKSNAVLSNNAYEELKAGEDNRITITVTAEDGSKKAYVVNIKREALTSDATLSDLSIAEYRGFKFSKDKYVYNVMIGKNVSTLTLTYQTSDENSVVDVEDNSDLKNGSVVKIIVKAQDGSKKVYTLNILKDIEKKKNGSTSISAEKNPLIILGLSMVAFALVGGIIYVVKK